MLEYQNVYHTDTNLVVLLIYAYLRYESGERTPSIHVIHFMANVLGTSADYLTGKTDVKTPNTYWVNAKSEPELFSLVEAYCKSDESSKERLLAYFSKLTERG